MVIQSDSVTPYAKYRLHHYGYNSDRNGLPRNDYEDVKVRPPSLQTTVTFGEGLKTPSDLFGSLKKAGQRFVGAEKLVQEKLVRKLSSVSVTSGHSRGKCQCRHHQKKLLHNENDENYNNHHKLSAINENDHVETQQAKGHTLRAFYIRRIYTVVFFTDTKLPLLLTFTVLKVFILQLGAREHRSRTPLTAT